MHIPGVGAALLDTLQQIAVGRCGVGASGRGLVALEYLVARAHANARQIPRPVDPGRALLGLYNPGVNRANAQRHAEQIAQQLGLAVCAVRDLDNRQRRRIQASLTRKNASTSHA